MAVRIHGPGTVLFVHGTGIRDVRPHLALVRRGVERRLGWPEDRVHGVDWGNEVGPAAFDVRPALPPEDDLDGVPALGWDGLLSALPGPAGIDDAAIAPTADGTAVAAAAEPAVRRVAPTPAPVLQAELVTHLLVARRAALMGPVSDFIRDVAFYLRRGDAVRAVVAREIRRHSGRGPVVVLGHSLGGIAAVDLLSDPEVMGGADPLDVALLVTVGSQAPLLHLLDALHALGPATPEVRPFAPWLNVYDRQDLLSFCATRVWPDCPGIVDLPVSQRLPFPLSHTAYFAQDRLYMLLRDHLPG